MPTYFGHWKENRAIASPADPTLAIPVLEGFIAQMKSQLESGLLKEAHEFLGGGAGYLITGDHPKEKIAGPYRRGHRSCSLSFTKRSSFRSRSRWPSRWRSSVPRP